MGSNSKWLATGRPTPPPGDETDFDTAVVWPGASRQRPDALTYSTEPNTIPPAIVLSPASLAVSHGNRRAPVRRMMDSQINHHHPRPVDFSLKLSPPGDTGGVGSVCVCGGWWGGGWSEFTGTSAVKYGGLGEVKCFMRCHGARLKWPWLAAVRATMMRGMRGMTSSDSRRRERDFLF